MNGSTTVLLVKEKLPKTTFDFQLISNSQENSTQTKKRKKQRTKSELLRRRSSQNSFPGLSSPHDEAFSTFQDAKGAFVDCSLVWVLLCVCSFVCAPSCSQMLKTHLEGGTGEHRKYIWSTLASPTRLCKRSQSDNRTDGKNLNLWRTFKSIIGILVL